MERATGLEELAKDAQLIDREPIAELLEEPRTANSLQGNFANDKKLVEVAGVEGRRDTSQLLGGLEDVKVLPDSHTATSPLSADASGQMLAAIVSNWHRLPDNLKRQMAELVGM